jgi:predicted phosphodiesterase
MSFTKLAFLLTSPLLATAVALADTPPVLSESDAPFTFAVLGDTHYAAPEFKTREAIHRLGDELRAEHPEVAFVCHTGDVVEGGTHRTTETGTRTYAPAGYEEMKHELTFATRDLREAIGRPVFIAVGNHDKHDPGGNAFREVVLPQTEKELGRPVPRTCYAFRHGIACFVFLDFAPPDHSAQAKFAVDALEAAKAAGAKHSFLFAHYPLWTVVRPGFYSPAMSESLLPVVTKHEVDAFFCGHTHNASVCVRRFDGRLVTQIQGITTGQSNRLIPIEDRRSLLPPAAETPFCWGFLEGVPVSYSLVRVDGPEVRVQWCVVGRGVIWEFAWRTPGELIDVKRPEPTRRAIVGDAQLEKATEAALVFCPWAEQRTAITVAINGENVAETRIGPTGNLFWEETRITIPRDKLRSLRTVNRVEIGNPERLVFGLAHLRLEVTLADGTTVATRVCGDFAFSCPRSRAGSRTLAWQIAPKDRIREVELGRPVGPVVVRFQGSVGGTP